jgi:hypothetical protein
MPVNIGRDILHEQDSNESSYMVGLWCGTATYEAKLIK